MKEKVTFQTQEEELENDRLENRASILRVFNYYRVFLSFSLLLLFLKPISDPLVGQSIPELFHWSILSYIGFNVVVSIVFSIATYRAMLGRTEVAFSILTIDVIFLCLLVYSSGGVASGISNLLIFPVAFAGVLVVGRVSVVIAAIAVILLVYSELLLMFSHGQADYENLFGAGLLGIVLFVVNLLFQYLSRQLRKKESEVVSLEQLNEAMREAEAAKGDAIQANSRFEVLVKSAGDGVLGVDLEGTITFANPKACVLLECPEDQLIGRSITYFSRLTAEETDSGAFISSDVLRRLQALARDPSSENRWITTSEKIFDVDFSCEATTGSNGEAVGGVIVFQDVTERKEIERKLNYMANYDGLTDLVNRTFFQTELEKAIARAERNEANVAVFLLDVDHFKYVNDRYGHDIGDKLLAEVSGRLTKCVRRGDTVARLGGDEFAILLLDFNSTDNLVLIANNLVEQVARPILLDDITLNVSTSIGVGILEGEDMSPDELLKTADTAMYAAKNAGRNTYRFFHPEMQARAEEKQRIQVALQQAIAHDEFELVYQPIYRLDDMSLHHSEALLRWIPTGGEMILPKVFIPLAEESGRITEIGEWVLNRAIHQLLEWRRQLGTTPRIAINISSKQIRNPHFRETIENHMRESRFDATALELELTETGVMDDPDMVMSELLRLSDLGIRISIDDFGTGYSSLDYLRRLPLDQIKIDKSFVRGIGVSEHDEEIVRVIIAVAHTMNIRVIAEGIETNDQLDFLKNCGGDLGQGYLFGSPLHPFELMEVYRRDTSTGDTRSTSPVSTSHQIQ